MEKTTRKARLYNPRSKRTPKDMRDVCQLRKSFKLRCYDCMYNEQCKEYQESKVYKQ